MGSEGQTQNVQNVSRWWGSCIQLCTGNINTSAKEALTVEFTVNDMIPRKGQKCGP